MKPLQIMLLSSLTILLTASFSMSAFSLSKDRKAMISERIESPGNVCLEGSPCANEVPTPKTSNGPRTGEQIFNTNCTACHSTGAAGAPIKGNAAQWKDRLAKGKETLYNNAFKGIGAMPAKGLCMDCSKEEINAAVNYLLE